MALSLCDSAAPTKQHQLAFAGMKHPDCFACGACRPHIVILLGIAKRTTWGCFLPEATRKYGGHE